jgi:preprotein translocase subunit SecB
MADEDNTNQRENTAAQGMSGTEPLAASGNADRQLVLQKIYIKDMSFESPKVPEVFGGSVTPQTQLNLRYSNRDVGQDNVEVSLTLTVEAKDQDTTLFLVELTQAGVFLVQGYTAEERATIVGSFCPNTLYPFAREAIADLVSKGGFPQLLLQPINFDALYSQALQQRAQEMSSEAPHAPTAGDTH